MRMVKQVEGLLKLLRETPRRSSNRLTVELPVVEVERGRRLGRRLQRR